MDVIKRISKCMFSHGHNADYPLYSQRTLVLVILVLLYPNVNTADSDPHNSHNISRSSGSVEIESRGYPTESYYQDEAYTEIWYISSPSAKVYIQLYFEDFHINEQSFIKIVDKNGLTPFRQPNFIYGWNRRPIFHSAGNNLVLLFKTGDANRQIAYNHGFRATIKWVGYPRDEWHKHNIPSAGFCGNVHVDPKSKYVTFQPPTDAISRDYLFDCIWYIPAKYMKVSSLKLKKDTTNYAQQLNVYNNGHLENPINAIYAYTDTSPGSTTLTSSSGLFLVRLKSHMDQGDYIKIQFSNNSYQLDTTPSKPAVNLAASQNCPFNTYQHKADECADYWENLSGSDETCLYLPYGYARCKAFKSTGECTHPDYDGCDGYVDCRSGGEDEGDTFCKRSQSEGFHYEYIFTPIIFLIFAGIFFGESRRGLRNFCQGLGQMLGNLCNAIGDCLRGLGRCIFSSISGCLDKCRSLPHSVSQSLQRRGRSEPSPAQPTSTAGTTTTTVESRDTQANIRGQSQDTASQYDETLTDPSGVYGVIYETPTAPTPPVWYTSASTDPLAPPPSYETHTDYARPSTPASPVSSSGQNNEEAPPPSYQDFTRSGTGHAPVIEVPPPAYSEI